VLLFIPATAWASRLPASPIAESGNSHVIVATRGSEELEPRGL
jgi:hypothetical protein